MSTSVPSSGERFGPWVVLDEPVRVGVACSSCGARRRIRLTELQRARGCGKCGEGARRVDRGGESAHPIYRAWNSMRHRVLPTAPAKSRRRYHDRGIGVCAEWQAYETFRAWAVGAGWAPGLQLDRRDNDRGYEPGNCRWVPLLVNQDNREATRRLTAWGETKLLAAWINDPRCVVDYHCLWDRLYRGGGRWTPERALSTPRRALRNNRTAPRYEPQPR